MWGPGSCVGPMWGFWWIFPVIGLLICLFFVIAVVRMMSGGGRLEARLGACVVLAVEAHLLETGDVGRTRDERIDGNLGGGGR